MNTLIKYGFIASALLSLTACVTDQKMKVQFEPTLPVPFLVVPDEGANSTPNNNSQQYTPPPPQQKDYRRDKEWQRYEDDEYHDYGY